MKLVDEFKAFALKGNVIDLAVGVVIGTAFGKIVSSLIADVIMPPIGWLVGGVNFSDLKFSLPKTLLAQDVVTVNYGLFLQSIFDFLVIAITVFLAVKFMIKLRVKEAAKPAAPIVPTPTPEQLLLTEIRDLLKENQQKNNIK